MPKTYVSNGYKLAIFAKVKGDSINVARKEKGIAANARLAHIGFGGAHTTAREYDNEITRNGFTRILPGQSIPFYPESRKRVLITLVTADERHVCENHSLKKGQNVIVDNNAAMKTAKKKRFRSKYHKWIDKDNKRIEPYPDYPEYSDDESISKFSYKCEDDDIAERKSLVSQKSHGSMRYTKFLKKFDR